MPRVWRWLSTKVSISSKRIPQGFSRQVLSGLEKVFQVFPLARWANTEQKCDVFHSRREGQLNSTFISYINVYKWNSDTNRFLVKFFWCRINLFITQSLGEHCNLVSTIHINNNYRFLLITWLYLKLSSNSEINDLPIQCSWQSWSLLGSVLTLYVVLVLFRARKSKTGTQGWDLMVLWDIPVGWHTGASPAHWGGFLFILFIWLIH